MDLKKREKEKGNALDLSMNKNYIILEIIISTTQDVHILNENHI